MVDMNDVGEIIGGISSKQDDTQDQLQSDEVAADFNIVQFDTIKITGNVKVIKKPLATDSFVIDHPVYGDIDSATLKIDGGYATSLVGITMPITMPITFSETAVGTSLLYEKDF